MYDLDVRMLGEAVELLAAQALEVAATVICLGYCLPSLVRSPSDRGRSNLLVAPVTVQTFQIAPLRAEFETSLFREKHKNY